MTYESFTEGLDHLSIKIYDGEGGECLSQQEHTSRNAIQGLIGRPTMHLGCNQISTGVQIKVLKPRLKSNDSILHKLPPQLIIAFGFASLVGSCIIYSYVKRKREETKPNNTSLCNKSVE